MQRNSDLKIKVKRFYEPTSNEDGIRVLVDRLWPRGVSKQKAGLDYWLKDIAPSNGLRKWYGHDPDRWAEFCNRYSRELDNNPDGVAELVRITSGEKVSLLFGSKEPEHNNAHALKAYLLSL